MYSMGKKNEHVYTESGGSGNQKPIPFMQTSRPNGNTVFGLNVL